MNIRKVQLPSWFSACQIHPCNPLIMLSIQKSDDSDI